MRFDTEAPEVQHVSENIIRFAWREHRDKDMKGLRSQRWWFPGQYDDVRRDMILAYTMNVPVSTIARDFRVSERLVHAVVRQHNK